MSKPTWREIAAELEEPHLKAWKPDPGEAIAGEVLSIDTEAGKEKNSIFVELRDEDEETIGLWLTTVLRKEFSREQVRVGDVVAIKYFGQKTSDQGREYKSFSVAIIARGPDDAPADDIPF